MTVLLVEKFSSPATLRIGDDHGIVVCAEDADEAMSLMRDESYDLVLVGIASLGEDGFDLIRRLRAAGNDTPLLALTGPHMADRTAAVTLGADEALAEPVEAAELSERMTLLLRHNRGVGPPVLRLGDLRLFPDVREAQFHETALNLTANEYSILELLVLRKGSVLTRTNFLERLYGGKRRPDGRIIDVMICKLRKKLQRAGAGRLVSVEWGHGYMIRELDALCQRVSDTVTIRKRRLVS